MIRKIDINPMLDLVLERVVDVPRELVWKAWTTPEHLKQFFVPKPWTLSECELELRPGGKFRTVMRSPDGNEMDNTGCYLEVIENELLVWTDSLMPGYRPKNESFMTAYLMLEDEGQGTKYTAIALHKSREDKEKHEEMGFHDGWGTVLDQLVNYINSSLR
ncbi:MAG: SRPBCC family protein [bacterium]